MAKGIVFRRIGGRIIPIKVAAELTGLAMLAKPSIDILRGRKPSEKKKAFYELSGLALLGAATLPSTIPSTYGAFSKLRKIIK